MMSAVPAKVAGSTDDKQLRARMVSPGSKELVIGLVGFAGAGCSEVGKMLLRELDNQGYKAEVIKLSRLIEGQFGGEVPVVLEGIEEGRSKLARARKLQDLGDKLRSDHGGHAVASLAIKEIIARRGSGEPGDRKIAFVLDSIKHEQEVELLRSVYEKSFCLVAVHCERSEREKRLAGPKNHKAKYKGCDSSDLKKYLDRDEKDDGAKFGQQVRDAFFLADYFLDNNETSVEAKRLADDIERLIRILLGNALVRPTNEELGMYYAYAASLKSSCLSRQVGAALQAEDGSILSTGTNEVPKFGGGVYSESSGKDHRCFAWAWDFNEEKFTGCHNSRLKEKLRLDIASWLANTFSDQIAEVVFPKGEGLAVDEKQQANAASRIHRFLSERPELLDKMPGIGDLIEYSRSIHAEMNALFAAATHGGIPGDCVLYTTTFPCHNCARHLITAGITKVYYIEPYVKSLAKQLHYDSVSTEWSTSEGLQMKILPFTGVGPRMYEDHFVKRGELKDKRSGVFTAPNVGIPSVAVRLLGLANVEAEAAKLIEIKS